MIVHLFIFSLISINLFYIFKAILMDPYLFIIGFLIFEVIILHRDNALIIIKFSFSSTNNNSSKSALSAF